MQAFLTATAFVVCIFLVGGPSVAQTVYAAGQVWKYHTRPEDPFSLLRIAKIEADTQLPQLIYHISVIGVHLRKTDPATMISHLPVSQESLDHSVTELTTSNEIFPDIDEGISQWRIARGGVFAIPVDQIVALVAKRADN